MTIHPFDLLMELDARCIRLDCAALHLARDVYPDCPLPQYLTFLDSLAEKVAELRPGLSANLRYEAMRQVIIEQYKFRGNEDDYYDPENSYLNRVIDRRIGVPISLSVIWLEVARRLKWPVSGVGLPGHFIIRFDDDERFVLVDPFRAGRTLSIENCREVLDYYYEGQVPFSSTFLRPVGATFILSRMLNNLRQIYTANHDWQRLSTVLKRLAAVEPDNAGYINELATLLYSQSEMQEAQRCLSQFLRKQPNADDQFLISEKLVHIEALLASLN